MSTMARLPEGLVTEKGVTSLEYRHKNKGALCVDLQDGCVRNRGRTPLSIAKGT